MERDELWSGFLIVRLADVFLLTPVVLTGFFIAIVLTKVFISAILGGLASILGFCVFTTFGLISRILSVIILYGRYCKLEGVLDGRELCYGRVREIVADGSNSSSIFRFGL